MSIKAYKHCSSIIASTSASKTAGEFLPHLDTEDEIIATPGLLGWQR